MELDSYPRKEVGALGERVAAEYLRRRGFAIVGRNIARKTGEIDVIARKGDVFHFVEVKSLLCETFPNEAGRHDLYSPSENLHANKLRKVARTAEWYLAERGWEGEWQVDGALVWLRRRDGLAYVRYLPQVL